MGFLPPEKAPDKWSASYFKMFVERLRTAINYMDSNNFPDGIDGSLIKSKTLGLSKMWGFEFQQTIIALATIHSVTSTTLTNVGGYLAWNPLWGSSVALLFEIVGGVSNSLGTATFELHGMDGKLAEVTSDAGNIEWLRSAEFEPPTVGQTLLVKVKTSNASYPAQLLSARLIIRIK